MTQKSTPAAWMRGGTSKELFFRPEDLPSDAQARDELFLSAIGSPDPNENQMNGMGGATSSTSKGCVVGKSSVPDCDVDFLFGHVSIGDALIDYSGNCGNLSSAVGVFAIEQGLVEATADQTIVRVWQKNVSKRLIITVPTDSEGTVITEGDVSIDGVSGTGAGIRVEFLNPGFDDSGHVFPTGNAIDILKVPRVGDIEVTLINAGNPTVFVEAQRLHLRGSESPATIADHDSLLAKLEEIRCVAGVAMGLGEDAAWISEHRPATPKICLLSSPRNEAVDVVARILSMGKPHHAMTGTGAIALAIALSIPDTVACRQRIDPVVSETNSLVIGHPAGSISVSAEVDIEAAIARSATMIRTARTLMKGEVFT